MDQARGIAPVERDPIRRAQRLGQPLAEGPRGWLAQLWPGVSIAAGRAAHQPALNNKPLNPCNRLVTRPGPLAPRPRDRWTSPPLQPPRPIDRLTQRPSVVG